MDGPSSGPASRAQSSSNGTALPQRTMPEQSYVDPAVMRNNNGNRTVPTPSQLCKCELTPVQRTVVREGPNQGRKFWVCPNSELAQCGFFLWDEDNIPGSRASSNVNAGSNALGGSGGQTGDCFKCGEPGHWASCEFLCGTRPILFSVLTDFFLQLVQTQLKLAETSTTSMGASAAPSSSSTACFKCGEEGHYSSCAS
ncbi:hypothetical protein DFH11DRAFT_446363 [Phellopilus nigrolimitatus]|nr:hypothetical protein DFH11DRAFT_446363 [Phellopilus nigrolimitatus]